jgi:hypothetical protein
MSTTPFDRRPSGAVRADVNLRAQLHLNVALERAYQEGLDRWACDNDAPFPDRGAIRARLEAELLVLCHGLGTWAAAPPERLFGRIDQRIRDAAADRDIWGY